MASILGLSDVYGHICGPSNITVRPGDVFSWGILSDVIEQAPSAYNLVSVSAPQVVAVGSSDPFSAFYVGKWGLVALAEGEADVKFHWAYSPFNASGDCPLHITVSTNAPRTAGNFFLSAFAGDPVNAFTGELTLEENADLDLGGPLAVRFQRYYASNLNADTLLRSGLGVNWHHNFDTRLARLDNRVDIVTYRGQRIQFQKNGDTWQPLNGNPPFRLVESGSNLVLGDRNQGLFYTFDGFGELISIADGKGNSLTLTYLDNTLQQVSDGLGRVLSFHYSGFQLLSSVDDGTRHVDFGYSQNESAPALLTVSDVNAGVTRYAYDPLHPDLPLLVTETLPRGNLHYTQAYDSSGRVIVQIENGVYTNSFSYAPGLTTVTDALGKTKTYAHNSNGQLTSYTDESNATVTLQNSGGRRTGITDRQGNSVAVAYDSVSGRIASLTTADGSVTTYAYSSRVLNGVTFYDLAKTTYADGTSETATYDQAGNLASRTDRGGGVWTFTYNAHGQLLTARNPLGGTTTLTYTSDGKLSSRSDSDTGPTSYTYDALGRVVSTTHSDGAVAYATYNNANRLTTLQDENGKTYQFAYDPNGNLTSATNPNGEVQQLSFDALDRMVRRTDHSGASEYFVYGALGHLTTITNRSGNISAIRYDALGRVQAVTDPAGKSWAFGFSPEGVLTSWSNPLNQTSRYDLDVNGNIAGLTDPLGNSTVLFRDAMQRVTQYIDELFRTNRYAYDLRGGVAAVTLPRVGSVLIGRNQLGEVSQITDLGGHQWSFGFTPMGRPNSLTDPLHRTTRLSFDSRGQISSTQFPDGVTRSNSYDPVGNLVAVHFSDGTNLRYVYDSLNRLLDGGGFQLAYNSNGQITVTTNEPALAFGASYDQAGRLISASYNNGAFQVNYTYDSRDRLVSVVDTLSGATINFSYDDAGHVTRALRGNFADGTYTYDAAGHLTRIQEGTAIDLRYALDAAGQSIQATWLAPLDPAQNFSPMSVSWTFDAASQISNPGFAYDAQGRLTSSATDLFDWDGASRLTQANDVLLAYNGAGDLVTRNDDLTSVRYCYNYALGPGIVAERDEQTGLFLRYYIWAPGGGLLYGIDANTRKPFYYHFDRVGSTVALTDSDGNVTDAYAYSPYGRSLGHNGGNSQPFTYIGRYGVRSEPGAGLYQMGHRYYDPKAGRFLSRDPLWPQLGDPQALNPYQYAVNNPLMYIDPNGLSPRPIYQDRTDGWTYYGLTETDIYREALRGNPLAAFLLQASALQATAQVLFVSEVSPVLFGGNLALSPRRLSGEFTLGGLRLNIGPSRSYGCDPCDPCCYPPPPIFRIGYGFGKTEPLVSYVFAASINRSTFLAANPGLTEATRKFFPMLPQTMLRNPFGATPWMLSREPEMASPRASDSFGRGGLDLGFRPRLSYNPGF